LEKYCERKKRKKKASKEDRGKGFGWFWGSNIETHLERKGGKSAKGGFHLIETLPIGVYDPDTSSWGGCAVANVLTTQKGYYLTITDKSERSTEGGKKE